MLNQAKRLLVGIAVIGLAMTMSACGGSGSSDSNPPPPTYTVGGTLAGLGNGLSVTLLNNGGNALTVNANGAFTFSTALANSAAYAVTVGTQPIGQVCTVTNGSGSVAAANVTNVAVNCVIGTYTIGGTVSGLGAGLSVGLLNNGGNALTVNANGAFSFTTPIASGAAYAVTVGTQPAGHVCTVTNGSGTVAGANVTNVAVSCSIITYTIGGTVSGLGAGLSVGLLNNGGNALTVNANGAFTFGTALAGGAAYAVTVGTQPSGQACTVSNGSGTVGAANVTNVAVTCIFSNVWTWKGGSNLVAPSGVYGTRGVPAATNVPGGRNWNASWKDPSGNFWILGGQGYDSGHAASALNDLWQYNPTTGIWTWMSGATTIEAIGVYGTQGVPNAANVPGAREFIASWTDAAGDLLLFGGLGVDSVGTEGLLNDLWRYSPSTGQWTWLGGPNTVNGGGIYGTLGVEAAGNQPGARYGAVSWTDNTGNVWMFGGYGVDAGGVLLGYLNDLWRYNPANGRWTWMSGSNTYGAPGVYGVKGTPAAANVPGSRSYTAAARVGVMLLLFGGVTVDAGNNPIALNDLWQYNTGSGQWTWISGSNLPNATGVYGTKGTPAPANVPGARGGHVVWTAGAFDMYLYVFGGAGFDSVTAQFSQIDDLNDLWRVDLTTGQWTWMNGSNLAGARGVYGTLGTPSASNQPGARDSGTAWIDSNGHVWLFGGAGYDSAGVYDSYGLNDVWEYLP